MIANPLTDEEKAHRGVWTIHVAGRRWRRIPWFLRLETFVHPNADWGQVYHMAQECLRLGALAVAVHPHSCEEHYARHDRAT